MEFSKKIVLATGGLTIAFSIITVLCAALGLDATEVGAITALFFSSFDVSIGFYFWKSKNENRIKLTKQMVKEWAKDYGVENVVSLAEIVLKE